MFLGLFYSYLLIEFVFYGVSSSSDTNSLPCAEHPKLFIFTGDKFPTKPILPPVICCLIIRAINYQGKGGQ